MTKKNQEEDSPSKKRVRLLLSYEGSLFQGWQKQAHTSNTIQNHIEKALSQIASRPISAVGAGRTDAGAHALGQTAHCDLLKIPDRLAGRINTLTPRSISCHKAWLAPAQFHAKTSAAGRVYTYIIFNTPTPSALKHSQGLWHPRPIHLDRLQAMAQEITGEKNFKSFQNSGTPVSSTVRTVFSARWFWAKPHVLAFQISANSFLKQMVRNLVGAQLKWMYLSNPVQKLQSAIQLKDRKQAPPTAPAHGLFLHRVIYPLSLDKKCQKL